MNYMPDKISIADVYAVVNQRFDRLEDKFDDRVGLLEGRTNVLESKTDNLLGKIGIGVMVVSAVFSSLVAFGFDMFKRK